jgi:hypothetical protein
MHCLHNKKFSRRKTREADLVEVMLTGTSTVRYVSSAARRTPSRSPSAIRTKAVVQITTLSSHT